jgi:hypothetical protein
MEKDNRIKKILEECYQVIACNRLDYEFTTILGNGINSSEASEFAWSILYLLEVKDEDAEPYIQQQIRELEEMYGCNYCE